MDILTKIDLLAKLGFVILSTIYEILGQLFSISVCHSHSRGIFVSLDINFSLFRSLISHFDIRKPHFPRANGAKRR